MTIRGHRRHTVIEELMTDGSAVKFPEYHDRPKRIDSVWTLREGKHSFRS